MVSRPTISDLAREAGVSVATVDRVLNGRHRVREETARRVYEAANAIGYHATSLIRQRIIASQPQMTFGFLLQKEHQPFYQAVARELAAAVDNAADIRGRYRIEFVQRQTPEEVAAGLARMRQDCDAVALVSVDHHLVTEAVADLKKNGIPTFSLLSDFAQGVRESYIGLHNMRVGRTAAWFISRTAIKPGKVAIFVGSHRWHGHELRETGFRSYFREYAPQFEILDTLVNLDTRQVTYEATLSLFDRHPDIAGLYVAGGGMEGAIKALREVMPNPLPSVVVNELTPDSRAALLDHLVVAAIATPLEKLCTSLIEHMIAAVRSGPSDTPGQVFLPFDIHVPESV
ncbi:MAG: LacI family DNA-binding transcriptional regulator [Oricola sp.]